MKTTRKSLKRKSSRNRRNAYAQLEQRRMLAGDVSVFMHNSMLFIRGDRAANQIQIAPNEAGDIEVSGTDGTTINGNSSAFIVDMEDGNALKGLRANLGHGNDAFFAEGFDVEGRAVVYGGRGDDSIGLYQVDVSDDVLINSSRGDDAVSVDEVSVGDRLLVFTDRGDDVIGVDSSSVAGLTVVSSGNGHDDVGLTDSVHLKSAYIFTGHGNDFLGTDNLSVEGLAAVLTGSGSDDVYVNDTSFNGRTYANGGSASDRLEVDGSTSFAVDPVVRRFEGTDVAGGALQTQQVFSDLIVDGSRLGTIVELAVLTPELSTLVGAVTATGLDSALAGDGPFTVFAPLNSAFAAISDVVAGLTTDQLRDVLLFHVTSGEVYAQQLVMQTSVDTLLGQSFSVEVTDAGVVLNGNATLAATDIRAKNGVIHLLNDVLVPGADTAT